MGVVKILGWLFLAGALLGVVLASFVAPQFLAWYNTPGAASQALCSCPDLTREVTGQLLRAQLFASAGFAVVFAGLGGLIARARRRGAAAKASHPPTAPAGPGPGVE